MQRLITLESHQSTAMARNSVHHQDSHVDQSTSSRASSVVSEYRSSAISGMKRKADSHIGNVDNVSDGHKIRYSSLQIPSMDYRSPADGKCILATHNVHVFTLFLASIESTSYRSVERARSSGFVTPLLPASRLLTGPSTSGINSLLSSPVGSSTRRVEAGVRDETRSPFTRADSQATIPEEVLPAHGSVHPSLQSHPSELVSTVGDSGRTQPDNPSSAFEGLPSAFFRSAHLRAEHSSGLDNHTPFNGLRQGDEPSESGYRNPNLTLPQPLQMDSPTSPFFRSTFDFEKNGDVRSAGRSTPVEPSPFLPPVLGTPALFENALPQLQDRHRSRVSVTSLTSDLNSLGKEEEAAANVLLALSSPEVMTPWQPASNTAQSLSSLERWSLDQNMASAQFRSSDEIARIGSNSETSSEHNETSSQRDGHLTSRATRDNHDAPTYAPCSSEPAVQRRLSGSTSIPTSSTSRIRKTAMDFLDMNRDMPSTLVSRLS